MPRIVRIDSDCLFFSNNKRERKRGEDERMTAGEIRPLVADEASNLGRKRGDCRE